MERLNRSQLASHPDYDAVIGEVIQNYYDPVIMAEAVKLAKRLHKLKPYMLC